MQEAYINKIRYFRSCYLSTIILRIKACLQKTAKKPKTADTVVDNVDTVYETINQSPENVNGRNKNKIHAMVNSKSVARIFYYKYSQKRYYPFF